MDRIDYKKKNVIYQLNHLKFIKAKEIFASNIKIYK